jgi:hypothetical protein
MDLQLVKARRSFRHVGAAAVLGAAVIAPFAIAVPAASAVVCTSYCGGGEYHALPFVRVFDTGAGLNDVAPLGVKPLAPTRPSFDVTVLGKGGLPTTKADVLAVALTVTVSNPTVAGSMAVYGAGEAKAQPGVNFLAHQTVATTVIVHPAFAGRVRVQLGAATVGNARIMIDVAGWYSTTGYAGAATAGNPRGWRTIPLGTASRILDTRNGTAADTPIRPNTDTAVTIRGARPVGGTTPVLPTTTAVAGAVLSVTAWSATAATRLTLVPSSLAPGVKTAAVHLYEQPGQVRSNLVIVPVGADGKVHILSGAGNTNISIDVLGYLKAGVTEASRLGRVVPLAAPFRAFDTKQPAFGNVPLGPAQAEDWSFASFVASVKIAGTWVGKQAGFLGTVTNSSLARQYTSSPAAVSALTIYPAGHTRPPVTTVNSREGAATSAPFLTSYGANSVLRVFNQVGYAHYLVDIGAVILAD